MSFITPVSLLTGIIAAYRISGNFSRLFPRSPGLTVPDESTGCCTVSFSSLLSILIFSLIDGCSAAEKSILPEGRSRFEKSEIQFASVPPEVKNRVCGSIPKTVAQRERAFSRASFAMRPSICREEGFP